MPSPTPQQLQQLNEIQSGIDAIKRSRQAPSNSGFKINVPDKIPSNVLGTNVTKTDVFSSRDALQKAFETYQSQSSGLQGQITAALAPSAAESAAEKSLLEKTQGYRQGLANIENKPIAMEFITGQSAALQKQASLDLLASSEALQSLTNKRKGLLEGLTTQLGFTKNNFEDILGISKEFRTIAKDEKDSARKDLEDIVTFAQGRTLDELDPETQEKISSIAANSGLTLNLIRQGLSNAKVAFDEARQKSSLELQKLRNDLNPATDDGEYLSVTEAQSLGVPYGTTKGQARTQGLIPGNSNTVAVVPGQAPSGKPDYVSQGFATRAVEAMGILSGVEENNKGSLVGLFSKGLRNSSQRTTPKVIQKYKQAERNFVNAVLRKESGAVISPEEFESARIQYFAQPGDRPEVILQKQRNRIAAANSLIGASGKAYTGTFIAPPNTYRNASFEEMPNEDFLNSLPSGDNASFFNSF